MLAGNGLHFGRPGPAFRGRAIIKILNFSNPTCDVRGGERCDGPVTAVPTGLALPLANSALPLLSIWLPIPSFNGSSLFTPNCVNKLE
eukprot:3819303-Rhodomonas_salina.1